MFICFDTEESSKQFLERSDIKSYKDNEMLVLSRYICAFNQYLFIMNVNIEDSDSLLKSCSILEKNAEMISIHLNYERTEISSYLQQPNTFG